MSSSSNGITPPHPLMERGGKFTTDELRQIVEYEGLLGLAYKDMRPAWQLVKRGLIELTELHGSVVATWIA